MPLGDLARGLETQLAQYAARSGIVEKMARFQAAMAEQSGNFDEPFPGLGGKALSPKGTGNPVTEFDPRIGLA